MVLVAIAIDVDGSCPQDARRMALEMISNDVSAVELPAFLGGSGQNDTYLPTQVALESVEQSDVNPEAA